MQDRIIYLTSDQLLQELYLKEEIGVDDIMFPAECIAGLQREGLISFNGSSYSITRLGKIAYGMGGIEEYYNYFKTEKPNTLDILSWTLTKRFFSFRSIFYSIVSLYLLLIILIILYFWNFHF